MVAQSWLSSASPAAGGSETIVGAWGFVLGAGVALVGAVGGAILTFLFNAWLKERDIREARRGAARAERREAYRRTLSYAVEVREFWEEVTPSGADPDFDPIATLRHARSSEHRARRTELVADLELVRAAKVTEAFDGFAAAANQCRMAFVDEMQKAGIRTDEDAARNPVFVGEAQSAVNREIRAVHERLEGMRDLMRDELYPRDMPPPGFWEVAFRRTSGSE